VTLYVNSDTQEVCTEAEMREAFTSAENDDLRGSQTSCRPVGSFNRSRWNTATTLEIPHGESPARGPTVPGLRLCWIFRTPPAHSV
jgi:hypothetical protein